MIGIKSAEALKNRRIFGVHKSEICDYLERMWVGRNDRRADGEDSSHGTR
jgi:hypothetical protein